VFCAAAFDTAIRWTNRFIQTVNRDSSDCARKGRGLVDTSTTGTGAGSNGASNEPGKDFVDFYQLLGADFEATTTALRRRINDLYSEAQSNRDHRNVTKRRRYEALCDLLPYCRIVLLDPDKRSRYDRYREQVEAGMQVPPFETMMDEIAGRIDDDLSNGSNEKIGLLGVEGDDNYLPGKPSAISLEDDPAPRRASLFDKPSARVSAPVDTPPTYDTPATPVAAETRISSSLDEDYAPSANHTRRQTSGSLTPFAYGVIALVIVTFLTYIISSEFPRAVLFGVVAGIVAFFVAGAVGNNPKNRRNRVS
jgi:hypothetical protein